MNARERAAMQAARDSRPLRSVPLDAGTSFVIRALDWILAERSANRLMSGAPFTLVLYDFSPPYAFDLGENVDLENGQASLGSIHLCGPSLRPAHVLPGTGVLAGMAAHQLKLGERQLADQTCVTFDPASGTVQVRLACVPMSDAIEMHLGAALPATWQTQDLAPLPAAIGTFHVMLDPGKGLGQLLANAVDESSARARIYYRNAMFLYLRYQVGLRETNGFRVTNRDSDVKVVALASQEASLVTAASTRSGQASAAAAMIGRLMQEASAAYTSDGSKTHISCIRCPSADPPNADCGNEAATVHHRHVKAA